MVVDSLNLAFRYHAEGSLEFASKYMSTINSLANSYRASKVILLGDWGSDFRYSILPDYKISRKLKRAEQSEEEGRAFKAFLDELDKAISMMSNNYLYLKYKGVEADDLAAYIVDNHKKHFDHIWLVSSDRDWDLLVDENVSRWSYRTTKEYRADNWNDYYPYDRENHIDIKCLMGDKGDDVPGVEGIAEKRAYNIINQYGGVYDIVASLPLDSNLKYIQNLNNFGERLMLNMQLMDLLTFYKDAIGHHNLDDLENKCVEYLYGK